MADFKEIITSNITGVLKSASQELIQNIARILIEEIGIENIQDLQLIREEDLQTLGLKPMQKRKLLLAWQPKENIEQKESPLSMHDNDIELFQSTPDSTLNKITTTTTNYNWIHEFKVPWGKMPVKLMKTLKKGIRPDPKQRKMMISSVVDEIRKVTVLPGTKAIRIIAQKMVAQYPSLRDMLDGDVIGDGTSSLFKIMKNRLENLNRKGGSLKRKQEIGENENQKNKCNFADKYGCINWQPSCEDCETGNVHIEKQTALIKEYQKGPEYYDLVIICQLSKETYCCQRTDINKNSCISSIIDKWPCIFCKEPMLDHFQTLVGVDLRDRFQNSINNKGNKIIQCLKTLPRGCNKNCLEAALKYQDLDLAAQIINALLGYFGEKINGIVQEATVTSSSYDAIALDIPRTPCLISCGNAYKSDNYILLIDGHAVNDHIDNFLDGFLMLFAAYFIFNIKYSDMASCTLEFIQRCFFSINPSRGAKHSKKNVRDTVQPKVSTLVSSLADFEWL